MALCTVQVCIQKEPLNLKHERVGQYRVGDGR